MTFLPRSKAQRAVIYGVSGTLSLIVVAGIASGGTETETITEAASAADTTTQPTITGTASEPTTTAVPTTEAPTTTAAPTTTTTTVAEDPEVASARGSADDYLDYMGFCRPSLISQLEYEGYSTEAATAAVDSLGVDWLAQTITVAENYVDYMNFSHAGLVDQLEYEGCEPAHAEHAATQVLGF